ncbi:MAG: beta-lactamase family protein, partial [Spirochaetes bacterium]|nr:beta-lactamase family protein [Spirochaetota bacterium]
RYLPDAACSSLGATVREVMAHSAGLPPIPELQRFFPDAASVDRDEAVRRLLAIEPDGPPGYGVAYSCTGFLLLGVALERLGGARLSELFRRQVAEPLGLSDGASPAGSDGPDPRVPKIGGAAAVATPVVPGAPRAVATFRPSPGLEGLCVPTEECAWRGRRVRGEVHDESSYCMGGDGGNAGLFANLAGAEALFGVWETGGGLLKPETVAAARACATDGLGRRRGLGIQLHDGETCDTPAWPADSYGHTGFTGTCAWAAPATAGRPRVAVVSLTNRVYRGRAQTAELIVAFRKALHGAVAGSL